MCENEQRAGAGCAFPAAEEMVFALIEPAGKLLNLARVANCSDGRGPRPFWGGHRSRRASVLRPVHRVKFPNDRSTCLRAIRSWWRKAARRPFDQIAPSVERPFAEETIFRAVAARNARRQCRWAYREPCGGQRIRSRAASEKPFGVAWNSVAVVGREP